MEAPADTIGYMVAGFVVIFGIIGLYLVSLYVRSRSLRREEELLLELEKAGGQNASSQPVTGPGNDQD